LGVGSGKSGFGSLDNASQSKVILTYQRIRVELSEDLFVQMELEGKIACLADGSIYVNELENFNP